MPAPELRTLAETWSSRAIMPVAARINGAATTWVVVPLAAHCEALIALITMAKLRLFDVRGKRLQATVTVAAKSAQKLSRGRAHSATM